MYIGASQEDCTSAAERSWFAYNFIKSNRSVNPTEGVILSTSRRKEFRRLGRITLNYSEVRSPLY